MEDWARFRAGAWPCGRAECGDTGAGAGKRGRHRSRRRGGWNPILVDFRSHHSRPKFFGLASAKRWFEVQIKEGVVDDEREKRQEKEALDGSGVVLKDMIGVPTVDQLVEAMIFDVPSLVPKPDGTLQGNLRRW